VEIASNGVASIRATKTDLLFCLALKFLVDHPKTLLTMLEVQPPRPGQTGFCGQGAGKCVPTDVVTGGDAKFSQFFSGDLPWLLPSIQTSVR
jgi:hypothetical protein